MDEKLLKKYFKKVRKIVTIEENVISGGFGSSILELTNKIMPECSSKIKMIGLENKFIENYGSQDELFKKNNLTVNRLVKTLID